MARPPRRSLTLAASALLTLGACAGGRSADESQLPEGVAPGSGSPRTDREVSRAPADRTVQVETASRQRLLRDHRGIPVPPGSAVSRALREGQAAEGEGEGEALAGEGEVLEGGEGEGEGAVDEGGEAS